MSTALDEFERTLVGASRLLRAASEAPLSQNGLPLAKRWRILRRLGRLSLAIQLGLAVTSISALAGGGVATYLLLRDEGTRTIASFQCATSRNASEAVTAVTGDPITDCMTAWPQASGGHGPAPRLAMWGTTVGKEAAVVQPASWGPPANSASWHWRRLPTGWTVDLGVVELTDQLQDISISPYGGPPCTYANHDVRIVRSLLAADGLASWRVVVNPLGSGAAVSRGCRFTIAEVDGPGQTVQLDQAPPSRHRPVHLSPSAQRQLNGARTADRTLATLSKHVNRTLTTRCESVGSAAALWTAQARAAGFSATTLAFWRAVNRRNGQQPPRFFKHYTLYTQPDSQHTGNCAHVLVMVIPGSGLANIYAARITP